MTNLSSRLDSVLSISDDIEKGGNYKLIQTLIKCLLISSIFSFNKISYDMLLSDSYCNSFNINTKVTLNVIFFIELFADKLPLYILIDLLLNIIY
jgi:hypothetical protein